MRTTPLPSRTRACGSESWIETRERLDATWTPLRDEKQRVVHGHAIIVETPASMLGRTLRDHNHGMSLSIGDLPFRVAIVATRDGAAFGAIPPSTAHATRELALAHAAAGLAKQGKRYARKYAARGGA